jgi:hypothetical protein
MLKSPPTMSGLEGFGGNVSQNCRREASADLSGGAYMLRMLMEGFDVPDTCMSSIRLSCDVKMCDDVSDGCTRVATCCVR